MHCYESSIKKPATLAKREVAHPEAMARALRENIVTSEIRLRATPSIRANLEREDFSEKWYGYKFFLQTVAGFSRFVT